MQIVNRHYDVYQLQGPPKLPKKCCPMVIVCNFKNVLLFLLAVLNFILTHIYTFHLMSLI